MFGAKKKSAAKKIHKVAPSEERQSDTSLLMPNQIVVNVDTQGLTQSEQLVLRGRGRVVDADSQSEGLIGPPDSLWKVSDYRNDPKIKDTNKYSELYTLPHWAATEPEDRVPIRFRCHWMELQNVDTVNQCFEVRESQHPLLQYINLMYPLLFPGQAVDPVQVERVAPREAGKHDHFNSRGLCA